MAKQNRNKKRKFGIWGWLVAGLMLIGGGFGVTQGGLLEGDLFGDEASDSNYTAPQEPVNINQGDQESDHVNITINESKILWNDELVNSDEMNERLENQSADTTYTIVDDSAIKATYDSVIETLNEQQLTYEEAQEQ